MRTWNLSHGVRLADDKQVLDFSKVVLGVSFNGTHVTGVSENLYDAFMAFSPHDQEISWIGLVSEKRSSHKIVIQGRNCLTRIHITKFHKWRLVLRLQDERKTKISLMHVSISIDKMNPEAYFRYVFVFFVLLTIVVNEHASHPKIGDDGGMFFLTAI